MIAEAQIAVESDVLGLQTALRELFEEAYLREAMASLLDDACEADRERALEDLPARTLSPGYYDRASYLLDLGAAIDAGVSYAASTLSRSDVRGLQALKRARGEYEQDHPSCGRCGTRQDNRWATQCRSCQCKFASGKGD